MPCCAVPGWVGLCRCNSGSCWGWLSPSGSLRAVCVCCAHVIPPIPRTAALALTALAPTCRSFVNFKKVADATRAYEQLVGEVRSFCVIFMHQKLSTLSPQGRSPACEQRLLRALLSGRTGLDRQQPHSALLNPPPPSGRLSGRASYPQPARPAAIAGDSRADRDPQAEAAVPAGGQPAGQRPPRVKGARAH